MPSNQSPLGALPSRFRRERVLIVGCGDIGLRVADALRNRVVLRALSSHPQRFALLRERGITPLAGNLDDVATLARLAALGTRVIHLAPPANEQSGAWWRDLRTQSLLRAIALRSPPLKIVYASTSGVYGDCAGQIVEESRTPHPRTPRAQRRFDAEKLVRHFARRSRVPAIVLRVPGIYGGGRGGGARDRLMQGTPVLNARDDVYTNHIHADDLARVAAIALWRGASLRTYNASDDTQLKMGDYYDFAAQLLGLPKPRRIPRSAAEQELSLNSLGFMNESRRLSNARMKRELRIALRYPTVREGLLNDQR